MLSYHPIDLQERGLALSQQLVPSTMNEMFYQRHVDGSSGTNLLGNRRIHTKLGCIDSPAGTAMLHVKLLLVGIAEMVKSEQNERWPDVWPVSRIELFGDWHTEAVRGALYDQGMVLFDVNNLPILHVLNALIGRGGSGPALTKMIFAELRINLKLFEEINQAYSDILDTDTPYYVVVQSTPNAEGHLEWQWSDARSSAWR